MTFPCDSCHSRLTISRALASFRLCSSDLEQYSGRTAPAVWLQSEQRKTKVLEQARGRKSARRGELRWAAGQCQAARPFIGQSGCAVFASASGIEGELTRPHPPLLCTLAHHSPSRPRRDAQELRWQGKTPRFHLKLLEEAARAQGHASAARADLPQVRVRLSKPGRARPRGQLRPQHGVERFLEVLKHTLHAQHAAHAHSPITPATRASWGLL